MAKALLIVAMTALALGPIADKAAAQRTDRRNLTDTQIRELIIEQSIAQHAGTCACPYSLAADGATCGEQSAYSRPGGDKLLCFARDVSDDMVRRFRER